MKKEAIIKIAETQKREEEILKNISVEGIIGAFCDRLRSGEIEMARDINDPKNIYFNGGNSSFETAGFDFTTWKKMWEIKTKKNKE